MTTHWALKAARGLLSPIAIAAVLALVGAAGPAWAGDYSRGVWFDYSGIEKANIDAQIKEMKRLGVGRVHLVVSEPIFDQALYSACKDSPLGQRKCARQRYLFGFDKWASTKANRAQLGDFVDRLNANQIQVVLMIWPVPTKRYLSTLHILADFAQRHTFWGVELEDEENWSAGFMSEDYATLDAAADDIFQTLRAGLPSNVKIGATTAPRNFSAAKFRTDRLLQLADFISFQTYQGVCDKSGEHCPNVKFDGRYKAGVMQQRGVETVKAVGLDSKPLILGLPAYDQQIWPNAGETNMYTALKQSVCTAQTPGSTILGDSYWSLKNIKRGGEYAYAKRFLLACAPLEIAKQCAAPEAPDITDEIKRACPGMGK